MNVYCSISTGKKKNVCDDSALIGNAVINAESRSFVDVNNFVCIGDGVGEFKGGKDASMFIMNYIKSNPLSSVCKNEIKTYMEVMNQCLIEYATRTDDRKQMATTFTGLIIKDESAVVVHTGNTRLYGLQGSYLKQMTKDHTTYQRLLTAGQYEAAELCNKNEITACFGAGTISALKFIDIYEFTNSNLPNVMILTSDGIHEYVDIDDLEKMICASEPDGVIAERITKMALENGSEDDMTITIVRR